MRTNSFYRHFKSIILFLTVVSPFNHTFAIEPVELAKLLASDASGWENFGVSVSLDGDTSVVGACHGDSSQPAMVMLATVPVRLSCFLSPVRSHLQVGLLSFAPFQSPTVFPGLPLRKVM